MSNSISSVAVDFIANTAKFVAGLETVSKKTKAMTDSVKKDTTDAANVISKSINTALAAVSVAAVTAKFTSLTKTVMALADEAEKIGANAEQFNVLSYAAKKFGTDVSTIKMGYKELTKSIYEAKQGTKETIDAFRSLGLSYTYLSSLNPDERFLVIVDALKRVSDSNERARLGTILLGRSYVELSSLISQGSEGIARFKEEMRRGGFFLSEKEIKTVDEIGKKFEYVVTVIEGKLIVALAKFEPQITAIANLALVIVDNFGKIALAVGGAFSISAINSFADAINSRLGGELVKGFGKGLGGLMRNFEYLSNEAAAKVVGGMMKTSEKVWAVFMFGASEAFGYIAAQWTGLMTAMATVGTATAAVIKTAFLFIVPTVALVLMLTKAVVALGAAFLAGYGGGLIVLAKVNDAMAAGLELIDKHSMKAAEYRKKAAEYRQTYSELENIIGKALGAEIDYVADAYKGLTEEQKKTIKATKDAKDAANKLALEYEYQVEITKQIRKETEEYVKSLIEFTRTTAEDVKTPVEKALDAVDRLNEAFLYGGMTIETYNRAMDALLNSLDYRTRSTILPLEENIIGLADSMRGALKGVQNEYFGIGTIVGGKLPQGAENAGEQFAREQERIKQNGLSLLENAKTAKQVYDDKIRYINAAIAEYEKQGRLEEALVLKTRALKQANEELFLATNPWVSDVKNIFSNFASGFEDAILQARSFSDVLKGLGQDIMRVILRQMVLRGLFNAIGGTGLFGGGASGIALGDMLYGGGKAGGGPVNSRTAYMVGENGPEMFVPNTNGYIIPNDMGGRGDTIVINQTFQTGVAQTVRAEMMNMLPQFRASAMLGVADAKQRGGAYSKALA